MMLGMNNNQHNYEQTLTAQLCNETKLPEQIQNGEKFSLSRSSQNLPANN